MREVAKEAIDRARRGEGPTLIEAETYRFRGHSLADPDELRLKSEKEHYAVCPSHTPSPVLPLQPWLPSLRIHMLLSLQKQLVSKFKQEKNGNCIGICFFTLMHAIHCASTGKWQRTTNSINILYGDILDVEVLCTVPSLDIDDGVEAGAARPSYHLKGFPFQRIFIVLCGSIVIVVIVILRRS